MSVSEQPSRIERLLDRARPSRRERGAAAEAEGIKHLVGLLCPTDPAPVRTDPHQPAPTRAGRQPYDGRTA